MSKTEVANFKKLLRTWDETDDKKAERALLKFLRAYRHSIVSALELAAR